MTFQTEECYIRTAIQGCEDPVVKAVVKATDPAWFKSSAARIVVASMQGLMATGSPINPGSIIESGFIERDTISWLMKVADPSQPPGDIKKLSSTIKASYASVTTQRRVLEIVSGSGFNLARDGSTILQEVGRGMSMADSGRLRVMSLSESFAILESGKPLVDRERSKNKMITGIEACDSVIRSGAGRLGIVAAINSAGKSSFMTQAAVMTASAGDDALLVTLEMSHEEVHSRAIANMTGTSSWDIYSGGLCSPVTSRMREIASKVHTMAPGSGEDWTEMEAAIRTFHQERKLGLVIIDYFQLMSPPDMHRNGTRAQEMGEMSKAAKRLAQDLGICVILISQFNREVAEGVEPKIDMLRDTGQLENDCDFALLMWTCTTATCPPDARLIGCRIAKNRGGVKGGLFHMFFMPATSRYREATT